MSFELNHRGFNYNLFECDCISSDMKKGDIWEPHLLNFMEKYIQNDFICLDIGANFGYHTLEMSRLTKGMIYSFEPQIENFSLLTKNVKNNNIQNVTLFNNAVGNNNDTVEMPIYDVLHAKNKINMGDVSVNNTLGLSTSTCQTIKLDDLHFASVDFVKIDVQGYELNVLQGMVKTIEKFKPTMVIEFEDHQLIKFGLTGKKLLDFIKLFDYEVFLLDYKYPSDHVCVHQTNVEHFKNTFKENIELFDGINKVCSSINHEINYKIKL